MDDEFRRTFNKKCFGLCVDFDKPMEELPCYLVEYKNFCIKSDQKGKIHSTAGAAELYSIACIGNQPIVIKPKKRVYSLNANYYANGRLRRGKLF